MTFAAAPLVVVMGVAGSGKSTVGTALATRLDVTYGEGDDFHSQANVDKMSSGQPLDDADRAPWLAAIGLWLREHEEEGAVMSCSALRRRYRDVLVYAAAPTTFLHVTGDRPLLEGRLLGRRGHFMSAAMLSSQLDTLEPLEPDEPGVAFDGHLPVDSIVAAFLAWYQHRQP